MKKAFLIPLAAALLVACTPSQEGSSSATIVPSSSTSSSASSSESSSTSISEESSSSSDTRLSDIEAFLAELLAINGHPNKATVLQENVDNYYGMDMDWQDSFTVERFTREGESDIAVRKGTQTIGDTITNYEIQTFVQGENIYLLKKEEDVPERQKSEVYDEASMLETAIGFSTYYIVATNLNYLANFLDYSSVVCEIDLAKDVPSEGTTTFSYSIAFYVNGTIDEKISHDWSITVSQGIITGYVHDYADQLYYGGENLNSSYSKETVTFEQGEYAPFSGEVWNPSDFPTSAS